MRKSFLDLTASDLNPLKLNLVSSGSIAGIGVGLLLSILLTSTLIKIIVGISLITFIIISLIKNIELLM